MAVRRGSYQPQDHSSKEVVARQVSPPWCVGPPIHRRRDTYCHQRVGPRSHPRHDFPPVPHRSTPSSFLDRRRGRIGGGPNSTIRINLGFEYGDLFSDIAHCCKMGEDWSCDKILFHSFNSISIDGNRATSFDRWNSKFSIKNLL